MDFNKTWHACAKNGFLLTALLLSHIQSVLRELIQFQKRKMAKNGQKRLSFAIERLIVLVVSMVISSYLKTVAEVKIGVVSSKFSLVLRGITLFLYL